MTKEQWSEFSDLITSNLNSHNTPLTFNSQINIQTTWHKIEHSFIHAAKKLIPSKICHKQSYNHQYTSHSTVLYLSLKKLGHLIKIVKSNKLSLENPFISLRIRAINLLSQCSLQSITSFNHVDEWIKHACDI